jgi:hypothetical protein
MFGMSAMPADSRPTLLLLFLLIGAGQSNAADEVGREAAFDRTRANIKIIFAQSMPAAQRGSDTATEPAESDALQAGMRDWARAAATFVTDKKDFGLFPSSSQIRAAGRLIAFQNNVRGEKVLESCSGVLISPDYFLTAAHCFCRKPGVYFANATTCMADSAFKATTYKVFLPAFGMFDIVDLPRIHPSYSSPASGFEPRVTEVADLGVAKINPSIPVAPIGVDQIDLDSRYILVSSGILTFKRGIEGRGLHWERPYEEGVQQLSGQKPPLTDAGSCPEAAADTVCIWYSSLGASSGPQQSSALCPADSGGALLRVDKAGVFSVVGIASYFWPRSEICDSRENRRSYFTEVARHSDWLKQFGATQSASGPRSATSCLDGIAAAPLERSFMLKPSIVTITAFSEESFGRPRPEVTIDGNPRPDCTALPEAGIYSCKVQQSRVSIKIAEGFAQLTICPEGR